MMLTDISIRGNALVYIIINNCTFWAIVPPPTSSFPELSSSGKNLLNLLIRLFLKNGIDNKC